MKRYIIKRPKGASAEGLARYRADLSGFIICWMFIPPGNFIFLALASLSLWFDNCALARASPASGFILTAEGPGMQLHAEMDEAERRP